ncbi:gamma-glutamylcyclotransferase-like isoform X2 [Patiria miniata]|uniref:gamma-glutamylcyclotransferase n=1 Tax=Patiria miniata TaxID=46514 RepID=A0A914BK42_PATMI|nr:gamma-glutamylcyclotransferase-like isoform X2 [Patiria miniata]
MTMEECNDEAILTPSSCINYRLQFCVKGQWNNNTRWKGGAATIEQSEGDSVWGVVWKLEKSDLKSLDVQEGVHTRVYRRLDTLQVTTATDQSILECISYQFMEPLFVKPSPYYLKVLQTGALQHGLPVEYRRFLDSIEHNGYDGPLPIFDDIMRNVKL